MYYYFWAEFDAPDISYSGLPLEVAHKGLNVTHDEFDAMGSMLSETWLEIGMKGYDIVKIRMMYDSKRTKVVGR